MAQDTQYLYATTRVRALEKLLLSRERSERMIDARSEEEALRVLEECGLTFPAERDVESVLADYRADSFALLSELSPDPRLTDIFRLPYDYHNLKVLLKAQAADFAMSGAASSSAAAREEAEDDTLMSLMVSAGRVPVKRLRESFLAESYSDLPRAMARVIPEARELLARTGDPQLTDLLLDKTLLSETLSLSEEIGNAFLIGYARLGLDVYNLRTVLRATRMGRGVDFFRQALVPGGTVDPARLTAVLAASGSLSELYAATVLAEAGERAQGVLTGGEELTAFERAAQNAQIAYLRPARYVSFGVEPLVAFLVAREADITAIRVILTGRRAGVSPEALRQRLRTTLY